ncbi:hypothetical protein MMC07_004567 [Pseudocyphellaria aurata]|nr:hypothetical protein [Pseudocyphellaria aurata]
MYPPSSLFILSLLFALPSRSSPALDLLHIQNVLSQYALIVDSGSFSGVPDFSALDQVFTRNVTIDIGQTPGVVRGLANVETLFRTNTPPGTITQNAVSTEYISLDSATTATAVSYDTITTFGTGNLTGQVVTLYTRFDNTLVKTKLPGNGGWRIAIRIVKYFVRPLEASSFSIPCI